MVCLLLSFCRNRVHTHVTRCMWHVLCNLAIHADCLSNFEVWFWGIPIGCYMCRRSDNLIIMNSTVHINKPELRIARDIPTHLCCLYKCTSECFKTNCCDSYVWTVLYPWLPPIGWDSPEPQKRQHSMDCSEAMDLFISSWLMCLCHSENIQTYWERISRNSRIIDPKSRRYVTMALLSLRGNHAVPQPRVN